MTAFPVNPVALYNHCKLTVCVPEAGRIGSALSAVFTWIVYYHSPSAGCDTPTTQYLAQYQKHGFIRRDLPISNSLSDTQSSNPASYSGFPTLLLKSCLKVKMCEKSHGKSSWLCCSLKVTKDNLLFVQPWAQRSRYDNLATLIKDFSSLIGFSVAGYPLEVMVMQTPFGSILDVRCILLWTEFQPITGWFHT